MSKFLDITGLSHFWTKLKASFVSKDDTLQKTSFPTLAFDGIPALYNGEYGLWDNVTNSFFGNAALSGSFTGA